MSKETRVSSVIEIHQLKKLGRQGHGSFRREPIIEISVRFSQVDNPENDLIVREFSTETYLDYNSLYDAMCKYVEGLIIHTGFQVAYYSKEEILQQTERQASNDPNIIDFVEHMNDRYRTQDLGQETTETQDEIPF